MMLKWVHQPSPLPKNHTEPISLASSDESTNGSNTNTDINSRFSESVYNLRNEKIEEDPQINDETMGCDDNEHSRCRIGVSFLVQLLQSLDVYKNTFALFIISQ
jgi:hypothetical protein